MSALESGLPKSDQSVPQTGRLRLLAVEREVRHHESWNGGRVLAIVDASIAELWAIDIVVSSDDNYLSHGGGASKAIWSWIGDDLDEWAETSGAPFRLGEVISARLESRPKGIIEVLHAITVDFDIGRSLGAAQATDLYAEVLRCAEATAASVGRPMKLALPILGSGAGHLAPGESLAALRVAIERWRRRDSLLSAIILVAMGENFEAAVKALGGLSEPGNRYGGRAEVNFGALVGARGASALVDAFDSGLRYAAARLGQDVANLTLSEVGKAYISARTASRRPVGDQEIRRLQEAISARNRLAHSTLDAAEREEAIDALVIGTEVFERDALAQLFAEDKPQLDVLSQAERGHGLSRMGNRFEELGVEPSHSPTRYTNTGGGAGSAATHGAQPESLAGKPAHTTLRSGTKHVRALRDFLQEQLSEEELADIDGRLTRLGYRGERSDKLLEFTLRMEQPDRELAGHVGEFRLRRAVIRLTGQSLPDHTSALDLALRLLDHFGYPTAPAPIGLRDSIALFDAARLRMASCSSVELHGHITVLAGRLEYLVLALIRFVCRVAFDSAPEPFFVQRGQAIAQRGLTSLSLGSLLALVEILSRELDAETSGPAQRLRAHYGTSRISVDGTQGITRLRNKFAHFEKQDGQGRGLETQRQEAIQFVDESLAFLHYLGGSRGGAARIFPQVVRVERVVVDRWGRRTIEVRTDEGCDQTMFTDDILSPGDIYFVHPFTNPIWVEFLHVPAGDLMRPWDSKALAV